MLAPLSVVEVGRCWAQRPAVFAAPALEAAPDRRCLLVLRMVLIALRTQMYVGGSPETSIKKPLNAFLGELFVAEWTDEDGHSVRSGSRSGSSSSTRTGRSSSDALDVSSAASSSASAAACACGSDSISTRLVAEQVSHHPPITAMHIADDVHGVRADGYARVEMTFSGAVQVRQVGHAIVRVDAYDEEYLIPLPDIKVRGFLSGRLYPEITDTYHIVGSNGYAAEIRFEGQGLMGWALGGFGAGSGSGARRNAFSARVFATAAPDMALYTVDGVWSEGWTTRDVRAVADPKKHAEQGTVIETYAVDAPENAPAPIRLPPRHAQDPWESRRAWAGVLDGLATGDLRQTVAEKSKIEQAQRRMRAQEAAAGSTWQPLFFRADGHGAAAAAASFRRLAAEIATTTSGARLHLHDERTKGVWRVDDARIRNLQRPFRRGATPLGEKHAGEAAGQAEQIEQAA